MKVRLAIDAMGGDSGPEITVPAVLESLRKYPDLFVYLVGSKEKINRQIDIRISEKQNDQFSRLVERLEIIPTCCDIYNSMTLSHAFKNSKGTSMRTMLELIADGRAEACVSAGHTGALMALATCIIKPLQYIKRPALATSIPNVRQGKTIVLDLGANAICDSDMLVQFAVMGSMMAKEVFNITNPRVALLNIGEEETKGLEHIKLAAKSMKDIESLNYVGYLEGDKLLSGLCDVFVCDGFSGNVALKTMEGTIKSLEQFARGNLNSSNDSYRMLTLLSRLLKPLFKKVVLKLLAKKFGYLHPDNYNGACLLGLRNIVIKSHGGANRFAFQMAIAQAIKAVEQNIPKQISGSLAPILSTEE